MLNNIRAKENYPSVIQLSYFFSFIAVNIIDSILYYGIIVLSILGNIIDFLSLGNIGKHLMVEQIIIMNYTTAVFLYLLSFQQFLDGILVPTCSLFCLSSIHIPKNDKKTQNQGILQTICVHMLIWTIHWVKSYVLEILFVQEFRSNLL